VTVSDFFSGENLQPMTIQQDQRMMSQIFFLRDELPAHDDATGLKGVCLKYFFLRDELPAHDDTTGSEDGVRNIFSQG